MIMCGLFRKIRELLGTSKFILFMYCLSCDPFFASDRAPLTAGPVGKKFLKHTPTDIQIHATHTNITRLLQQST